MKYHLFLRRVSTAGQDISMQQSADQPFRDKLDPQEIKVFEEFAVSANKLSIKQRPEMQKVIAMIESNQVDTIYAFDRTRLFRDKYEAMAFIDLCLKHGVKIYYTSEGNGHIQSTGDMFLEGVLATYADLEGQAIKNRNIESTRRYPNRKFGYQKDSGTKSYSRDSEFEEIVDDYFEALLEVSTVEDLAGLLKEVKTTSGRNYDVLINVAQDPFYAGYDLSKGENKLSHVEPYIDLNTFYRIQDNTRHLFKSYIQRVQYLDNQKFYAPVCGVCHSYMKYKADNLNNVGIYSCKKGHRKNPVSISTTDLHPAIDMVLQHVIDQLDAKKIQTQTIVTFRDIRKTLEREIQLTDTKIAELMEELIFLATEDDGAIKENAIYKKMAYLKSEKQDLLDELWQKEKLMDKNKTIANVVSDYLHDRLKLDLPLLFRLLINNIYVHPNVLEVDVYMFDYLENIATEFVYEGAESV